MNGENYCRPVVNSTRKKSLIIGFLIGAAVLYLVARFGWLTF